jgi:hypothetical protein
MIDGCGPPSPDPKEIVVCGSRRGESPYRLPKLPREYDEKPLRAETDIMPGVHTRAHVESGQMPDGNVAKRLMLTFSLPF